jgi:hypothetical protein
VLSNVPEASGMLSCRARSIRDVPVTAMDQDRAVSPGEGSLTVPSITTSSPSSRQLTSDAGELFQPGRQRMTACTFFAA